MSFRRFEVECLSIALQARSVKVRHRVLSRDRISFAERSGHGLGKWMGGVGEMFVQF